MRRYEISPAMIATLRNRALATSFKEVGMPLHLELPSYGEPAGAREIDAEDARTEAENFILEPEDDDDFY